MNFPSWLDIASHVVRMNTIDYQGRSFEYVVVSDTSMRGEYPDLPDVFVLYGSRKRLVINDACPEAYRGPMLVHMIREYFDENGIGENSCLQALKAELAYAGTLGIDLVAYRQFRLTTLRGTAVYVRNSENPDAAMLKRLTESIRFLEPLTPAQ